MSHFFNPLEGTVLLRSKGLYQEAKLFESKGVLYAQFGKGFLKLLSHERTSMGAVNWTGISGNLLVSEDQGFVRMLSITTPKAA
jgi:hypothetical protein